ncbi:MAG: RnfABCDGE type electron transport complex subunit G [Desulfobacterales bacterium]|uniref:Ion-translocating oxidoreductase complex subunit G n=1 Tax=Candidatus Desulfaltia bathyphila TaxID=2841697 RepID=A0A8J6N5V7_9BACT|nr:RnfABCDGE type electron transport complex subunit G [Candidatus Desulfaltia bathyphila]MBL7195859.1 RnfABCDGE type electron transport complex subunit G [Desulfobacterales bacterium]MBL7207357.1 RnfABCDGE type electron transport complex subunit G [Desulfobacterales bacterium]
MREIIKMIVVLTVLSAFSGGLLAAVRGGTMEKIEYQQLVFVKGPAIRNILEGCSNDPIVDRFKIKDGDIERSFFVGVFDGKADTVTFESFGKGFGGDIGLMVGVNINDDKIIGMGVTTHSETPGIGSKAKTDPKFSNQFKGLSAVEPCKVKPDGGEIDAMSGATVTSKGVCVGVTEAGNIYKRLKPQIAEKMKEFK